MPYLSIRDSASRPVLPEVWVAPGRAQRGVRAAVGAERAPVEGAHPGGREGGDHAGVARGDPAGPGADAGGGAADAGGRSGDRGAGVVPGGGGYALRVRNARDAFRGLSSAL